MHCCHDSCSEIRSWVRIIPREYNIMKFLREMCPLPLFQDVELLVVAKDTNTDRSYVTEMKKKTNFECKGEVQGVCVCARACVGEST